MNKNVLIIGLVFLLVMTSVSAIKYPLPSWASRPLEQCLVPMPNYADGTPHTPVWGLLLTKSDGSKICVVPRRSGNNVVKKTVVTPTPTPVVCVPPSPVPTLNCIGGYECVNGKWVCTKEEPVLYKCGTPSPVKMVPGCMTGYECAYRSPGGWQWYCTSEPVLRV
jgi:hypothetical protein